MSEHSVERKKKSESNVYLTAVSGINFGKGAKTSMIPSQLVMVSPKDPKRQTMKDDARKGDTKSLNKAIGLPTDKESVVTFDASTHKLASNAERDSTYLTHYESFEKFKHLQQSTRKQLQTGRS